MKQHRLFIIIAVAAIVLITLVETFRSVPVDWNDSFSREHKIPYGAWILYDQLPSLFPDQDVEVVDQTVYQRLVGEADSQGVYVLLNANIGLSATDTEELLWFVENGGTAFIAAESLSGPLADSLGVEIAMPLNFNLMSKGDDSIQVNFSSPALQASEPYAFAYPPSGGSYYFVLFDEDASVVLGTTVPEDPDEDDVMVNFLKVPWGNGAFYLSSLPRAFSNLELLTERGQEYASTALSYLPVEPIIWDEYYKVGRAAGREEIQSPMRYVFSQDSLRWGYLTLMIGGFLFVVFGARRRQRIIPVVEPPRNTTVEFVETVGRLYHQHGDFRNVADKMILYLLDYIRTHLDLPTVHINEQFIKRVSERSGIELSRVTDLFDQVRVIEHRMEIEKEELLQLSDAIEYFYRNSQR